MRRMDLRNFSRSTIRFWKRAAFGAALFLSWAAFPANKSTGKETYKDIIDKAYNLSLQHDRPQALTILVSAAKKESKKGPIPSELLSALEEVSGIFYSDKAQQLYELALSFKQTDPQMAMSKLSEASLLEPDNLSILIEMQRVQIETGECSAALKLGEKISETNPYSDIEKLHCGQAAVCAGKFDVYAGCAPADLSKGSLSVYWQIVNIERLFKKAEYSEALERLTQVEKVDPRYPESQYWRWKIQGQLNQNNEKAGQKYLTECHKVTPRQLRDMSPDPKLCRRLAEVENSLKKSHNP
jgi:tetratricopeptide (TPR) repeat protein